MASVLTQTPQLLMNAPCSPPGSSPTKGNRASQAVKQCLFVTVLKIRAKVII